MATLADTTPGGLELMERAGKTTNLAVIDDGEPAFVKQAQCRELANAMGGLPPRR
jgi:DNA-binding IclR family transcriptional regulator